MAGKLELCPGALMTHTTLDSSKGDRLTLRSELGDLRLIPSWIEYLASQYAIPANVQYAMNLCLEEVLSNIIRHGYGGKPDRPIVARYALAQDGSSLIVIDDEAPAFNPVTAVETPVGEILDGTRAGGLGLRLVRTFANSLHYERTPSGNRLSIGFRAGEG